MELSLAIVYGFLVLAFSGWGVFYRKKRSPASRIEHVLNATGEGEQHSVQKQEDDSHPPQVCTFRC